MPGATVRHAAPGAPLSGLARIVALAALCCALSSCSDVYTEAIMEEWREVQEAQVRAKAALDDAEKIRDEWQRLVDQAAREPAWSIRGAPGEFLGNFIELASLPEDSVAVCVGCESDRALIGLFREEDGTIVLDLSNARVSWRESR